MIVWLGVARLRARVPAVRVGVVSVACGRVAVRIDLREATAAAVGRSGSASRPCGVELDIHAAVRQAVGLPPTAVPLLTQCGRCQVRVARTETAPDTTRTLAHTSACCRLQVRLDLATPPGRYRLVLPPPPRVTCKAWVLADADGHVVGGVNPDAPLQPASMTKILTALVVAQQCSDGAAWDELVEVSAKAAACKSGTHAGLRAKDRLSVRDLMYGLMLPSGNDAALALAEHFGPRE